MANKELWTAKIVLALLTLVAAISLYQVAFCAWMTAYAPANASEWRARFYVRLVTSLVVGLLWIAALIWVVRKKRQGSPTT